LVEYLWGNRVGQVWSQSLATDAKGFSSIKIFPNPTMGTVFINGIKNETVIDVFSLDGRKLKTYVINQNTLLNLNVSSGIYLLKVFSNGKIHTEKVVVN
jgi:hypothetical protein